MNKLHLLKKAENLIEDYTNFYVKRITPKNDFNLDNVKNGRTNIKNVYINSFIFFILIRNCNLHYIILFVFKYFIGFFYIF